MTKTISITMAIIMIMSAGFVTPPMNYLPMTIITASAKTKPSPQKKKTKPKKEEKAYSLYAEKVAYLLLFYHKRHTVKVKRHRNNIGVPKICLLFRLAWFES